MPKRINHQLEVLALNPAADPRGLKQRQYNDEADALVQSVRGLRVRRLPPPGAIEAAVRQRLGPDAALIDVASYRLAGPRARRYLAFLVRAGQPTRVVDLGTDAELTPMLRALHQGLPRAGWFGRPGPMPEQARALYERLLAKGQLTLGEVKKIFFAPRGVTFLIPLGSLHDGSRYLMEKLPIIHLTSGRDLLRSPPEEPGGSPAKPLNIVAFVDPDQEAAVPQDRADDVRIEIGGDRRPLDFALAEGQFLRQANPTCKLFSRGAATKESLLGVAAPGILHLAMHALPITITPRGGLPQIDNALVLSGARRTPGAGLLTSPQVSAMNLMGTQVAFLSACELMGHDVSGSLWRAFLAAGAESGVTTLASRPLDSAAAAGIMVDYYERLSAGEGRAAALQQALVAAYHRHGQPYYLSAFAIFGDDRPLSRPLHIDRSASAALRWRLWRTTWTPRLLQGLGGLTLVLVGVVWALRHARARRTV